MIDLEPTPTPPDDSWRSAAARRFAGCAMLLVGGLAVLIAGRGVAAQIVGACLVGIALTIAVALVFLEVGLSEDRELAREQREREPPPRARLPRPARSGWRPRRRP